MKYYNNLFLLTITLLFILASCKKESIIDGGTSDAKVDMTTYDYLAAHPRGLFDTLLMIIDKAEMKNIINGSGTMFVPTDYSINAYINAVQAQVRQADERRNFNLDSLFKQYSPQMLRDSMSAYFFPEIITRDGLDANGDTFAAILRPYDFLVTLEEHTNEDYNAGGLISQRPKFMFFNRIIGERDIIVGGVRRDPSNDPSKVDMRIICQTTGIISTTGIIHVLDNSHVWSRSLKLNIQ